jgi:hypothetical protein
MIPEEAPMDGQTVHSDTGNPTAATASEPLRLLWRIEGRKQFRAQTITAAIYRHPLGQELRILLGVEEDSNVLHSELARFDSTPLEEKAAVMREVLIQNGWRDLASTRDPQPAARQSSDRGDDREG